MPSDEPAAASDGLHAAAPASPGTESAPRADEATVRALLRSQLTQLADEPLVPGPTGWDNVHWLVGDHAVRLPRRAIAVPLVDSEVRVLRAVGDRLPLLVPTPSHVGQPDPDAGWPWPWTLIPWFGGERSDLAYPPAEPAEHAVALGSFLRALHEPATADAPVNPHRGIPLLDRADRTERSLNRVEQGGWLTPTGRAALRHAWADGRWATPYDGPPVWLHGDLHPGNQVVVDGVLAAIVDWGDGTAGDPACDLATAWWTLPVSAHPAFRDAYGGVDEQTWARGRGWAAAIAAVVLADGVMIGDPAIVAIAHRTVDRFVEDRDS